MTKFRIVKETTKGGDSNYYPQVKKFLRWRNIDATGWVSDELKCVVCCYTLEQAEKCIKKYIEVVNLIDNRKLVKKEILEFK